MAVFIGIASGLGAGNQGCAEAPLFFQRNPHLLEIEHRGAEIFYPDALLPNNYDCLNALYSRVAQATYEQTLRKEFFVAFGGDHACAIGTWSGVAQAKQSVGGIGLIWIDAHMDSHTPQTSETGNIHGMPLAALMGHGDPRLTKILSPDPKISPSRVSLIGVRSFESGEAALLKKLGVRVYCMDEVQQRGLCKILPEAIERAGPSYGLSFDLDSIDPSFVKAVGTPVKKGLRPEELLKSFALLREQPPIALEIVEYNPFLDADLGSAKIASRIIEVICSSQP